MTTIDQLVFVGLQSYALALDRDTGEIVWYTNLKMAGHITLLLDGDRLIVSTNGYIYCLDPLTGHIRWNNSLRGYGMGETSLASRNATYSVALRFGPGADRPG